MSAVTNSQSVTKDKSMEVRMSRGRSSSKGNHTQMNISQNNHDGKVPPTLNLAELKKKDISALIQIAKDYNIENANSMRVQELIFALLQAQTRQNGVVYDAIGFNLSDHYKDLITGEPVDIAYVVEENVWQGISRIQLNLRDIKQKRESNP